MSGAAARTGILIKKRKREDYKKNGRAIGVKPTVTV